MSCDRHCYESDIATLEQENRQMRNYSDGDRHIAYSFKVPEEATPSDVHEQFAYFLNAIYGWDVRKHLYENITP